MRAGISKGGAVSRNGAQRIVMATFNCGECKNFLSEPGELEHALPGLAILSSGYASVRSGTAICIHHGIFIAPAPACPDFMPRTGVPLGAADDFMNPMQK